MKQSLKALIVDDSSDDAALIAFELERGDFEVVWKRVDSAADLRARLLADDWDILLSDYSMPQFNALDALSIAKELKPDLPSIVISGAIGEDAAVACIRAGANDFFVKGNLGRLPAAIRRQLLEVAILRQSQQLQKALLESETLRWRVQEEALLKETASRKEIEELLLLSQEGNRQKEEFLTVLSHELRTPMNAIIGWAELLVNKECHSEEYPEIFEAIFRNAHAQNKLINDLLDLSRITTGKLALEKMPVRLEEIARSAIESLELAAKLQGIQINFNHDTSAQTIMGDSRRLLEVLWNLLSNSIKFTPRGGSIDLGIHRRGEKIEIKVSDTGCGITPNFLPFVFDKFRQEDGSLNRKHGGLGLGLSLVKNLVQLHGGEVEAYSAGPGEGTTITIRLPANPVNMQCKVPEIAIRPSYNFADLRVLIVDDHQDSLVLLERRLKGLGIKAISTLSASKALQLFKENPPDIFLSDIEMPEMNGNELIREIRNFEKKMGLRTPCGALTAHARPEDVERVHGAGFDLHIAKPIDAKRLLEAITFLTSQWQMGKSLDSSLRL